MPDDDLPALYGCADVFAMLCRNRWLGLEQEGFGIVFLEAAPPACRRWPGRAAGRPRPWSTARPALVVGPPTTSTPWPPRSARLLDDAEPARRMGAAARRGPSRSSPTTRLARRLADAVDAVADPPVGSDPDGALRGWWRCAKDPSPPLAEASSIWRGPVPAVFLVAAVAATLAPDALGGPFAVLSCALFVVGCVTFLMAYALAVSRSRHEALGIGGIYFLDRRARRRCVRFRLLAALGVQVAVAVAAASVRPFTAAAFGVLAPMFGLGLAGLWGSRYGMFPARAADGREPRLVGYIPWWLLLLGLELPGRAGPARLHQSARRPLRRRRADRRSWQGWLVVAVLTVPILVGNLDPDRLLLRRHPAELARLRAELSPFARRHRMRSMADQAPNGPRSLRPPPALEVATRLRALPRVGARHQGGHVVERDAEGRGAEVAFRGRGHGPQHQLHAALRLQRRPDRTVVGARPTATSCASSTAATCSSRSTATATHRRRLRARRSSWSSRCPASSSAGPRARSCTPRSAS